MRENGDEASVSPSVGEFIRKLRQLADLSLRQTAELAHVSTPISARSRPDRRRGVAADVALPRGNDAQRASTVVR
jgi:transcriptional regulator with XRE-family HTH domain